MTKILDTVVSYEDQLVGYVKKAKGPVTEYVAKGVDLLEDRVPEVTYPKGVATPIEVVETQVAFMKKMIDANAALVTSVLKTVAPLAGYDVRPKKVVKAAKAA
jgi:hypothetical protein